MSKSSMSLDLEDNEKVTMAEALLQLSLLQDFIKLMVWTGQLPDERPLSAIIVAPAGSGKTSILESVSCEQAVFAGDLTARSLSGIINEKTNNAVTHILLGDMLSLFGHKSSTVNLTLRLISQMTGEKLLHDPWTGVAVQPRMVGLITGIPPRDFEKHTRHIMEGGFASRFLVVKYTYRASTIAAIHRFISENRYSQNGTAKPFTIDTPGKYIVDVNKEISEKIKDLGMALKKDPLGFRAHRHLRALVKAEARRNKRNFVKQEDFEKVQSYCDFFSKEGKEI